MPSHSARIIRPLAAAGLAWLLAAPLAAQSPMRPSHLRDPWQINASATLLTYATDMRVDASNGTPGTDLDPENDLGLPATVVRGQFGLRVRIARRHELEVSYLVARRSGEIVLRDTITVGDTTYAAGLRTQSDIGSDNLGLVYRFAFHMHEHHEIGATLGLGALMFGSTVRAVAGSTPGGPDTTIVPYASQRDLTVPTAAVGLYGRWQVGERWNIESDVRALFFTVERVTASVIDASARGRYWVNGWLGLEAGYAFSSVKADLDPRTGGTGFSGRFKYGLHNLRLGIVATKTRR